MPDPSSDAGGPHLERAEQPTVETPPATAPDAPPDPRWWGAVTLGTGEVARWQAGPSTVHAARRPSDWRVWHETEPDAYAVAAERVHRVHDATPETVASLRFSFAETPDTITVRPALADRPVVVRPESSLTVPPGERVVLYVSSPVWMALKLEVRRPRRRRNGGAPQAVVLAELPTFRPSDTWFGPSTRVGQLCYAVRTAARLELADLPLRPHRAVTPVTVDNQAATPLELARVSVPMPNLALHVDRHGRLWSDGVLFTREPDDDTTVRVTPYVPQGGERLAEPRSPQNLGQTLSKTFNRLLKGDAR
jgi:hypothetical protein